MLIADQGQTQDMLFDIETAAAWHAASLAAGRLPFWIITYNTIQYPGIYVARPWTAAAHGNGGANIQAICYSAILVGPTLAAIRGLLPLGMLMVEREEDDHPDIVEKWFS